MVKQKLETKLNKYKQKLARISGIEFIVIKEFKGDVNVNGKSIKSHLSGRLNQLNFKDSATQLEGGVAWKPKVYKLCFENDFR